MLGCTGIPLIVLPREATCPPSTRPAAGSSGPPRATDSPDVRRVPKPGGARRARIAVNRWSRQVSTRSENLATPEPRHVHVQTPEVDRPTPRRSRRIEGVMTVPAARHRSPCARGRLAAMSHPSARDDSEESLWTGGRTGSSEARAREDVSRQPFFRSRTAGQADKSWGQAGMWPHCRRRVGAREIKRCMRDATARTGADETPKHELSRRRAPQHRRARNSSHVEAQRTVRRSSGPRRESPSSQTGSRGLNRRSREIAPGMPMPIGTRGIRFRLDFGYQLRGSRSSGLVSPGRGYARAAARPVVGPGRRLLSGPSQAIRAHRPESLRHRDGRS